VRSQFPILGNAPGQAYLDSAATSQKPRAVLDAVQKYLTTTNANADRGGYRWASRTTRILRDCERQVAEFLGAGGIDESSVHFTSGTTGGLQSVALDWLTEYLADGDEIVVPLADHRANCVPWSLAVDQLARRGTRARIVPMPYGSSGDYDPRALAERVSDRTRFVALTHVHHVYGVDMNIHRIRDVVGPDTVICLDAAQSVGHLPVDLAELDVDFLAFSGHKAMALPGAGALWARNVRGRRFEPVGWRGTPNTVGAVSLAAALAWLSTTTPQTVARWTTALTARLTDWLDRSNSYRVLGCQRSLSADSAVQRRTGLVSFHHERISSTDLGFVLAEHGLMVRADRLCQGPAGRSDPSVRVSVHAYTSPEEIDRLIEVLENLDTPGRRP
jgi:cysteine desulfurase / selenocysteine lyase